MRRVIAIDALYACAALGTCMAERGRHAPLRMLAFLLVPTTDPERLPLGHYQALYAATPVLQRTFRTRRWRRRRRPHRSPDARSSYRLATPMVMIDQRPTAADDRVEVGHWEGDLIMGLGNGSAIGTLVERSTRTLILVHLPHGGTAAAVRDALTKVFTDLPVGLRRSLTWDQGKELSAHTDLTRTWHCRSTSASRTAPGSAAATRT